MTGHIDPTKDAFAAFRADDRPGPIHMLNLVRLRPLATVKSQARNRLLRLMPALCRRLKIQSMCAVRASCVPPSR